jgi:hypothetical protein
MHDDLQPLRDRLVRIAEELDGGRARVTTDLQKLQGQVEQFLARAPRVRRLRNALGRAAEDLPTARVLVDAALRQVQEQIEAFLAQATDGQELGRG